MAVATGEVRICWREDQYGKAYIISMGGSSDDDTDDARSWAAEQVNAHIIDNRVEDEDFAWVQELINKHMVPSPHCPISWAAVRGTYDPVGDAFAVCIVADVHPTLEDENFYIATFPMGPWEDRVRCVELGLRAMALQRYVREQVVGSAALTHQQDPTLGFKPIPMPLPGLRLRTPPIPPTSREEWGDEIGFDWDDPEHIEMREKQAAMDLCSAIGGIDDFYVQ